MWFVYLGFCLTEDRKTDYLFPVVVIGSSVCFSSPPKYLLDSAISSKETTSSETANQMMKSNTAFVQLNCDSVGGGQ